MLIALLSFFVDPFYINLVFCPYSVLARYLKAFLAYSRYLLPSLCLSLLYLLSKELSLCDVYRYVAAIVLFVSGKGLRIVRRAVKLFILSIFSFTSSFCMSSLCLAFSSSANIFWIFLEWGGGLYEFLLDTWDLSKLAWLFFFHSRYSFSCASISDKLRRECSLISSNFFLFSS